MTAKPKRIALLLHLLSQRGYRCLQVVEGAMAKWKRAGFPVVR